MQLVGVICRHEAIYQIMVQIVTDFRTNSVNLYTD